MTPVDLVDALADELELATAQFVYPAEHQPPKHISIYRQNIPREEFEVDSFYPFILVELLNFEDTPENSTAALLLTFGTYGAERRGDSFWREHLNLVENVRQYVQLNRTIGGKFILVPEIYCGMVERQSESFMYSNMFLRYYIGQLRPAIPQW